MIIKQSKTDVVFDIVNLTLLMIVLVIVLYPLIFVVSASLSNPLAVFQGKMWLLPKGFNIDAYRRVFQNSDIMMGYRNTIIYTVVGTTFNLIMTIMGAYPLSRRDFYGRGAITAFIAFTMFIKPGLIPNYMLIKSMGLVNNFWVMIIPGAVSVWNMVVMRTFFQNTIPNELYESAFIDGASNTKVLLKIVLPLSAPVIAIMVLFYGVGHWNAFFNALIYISDRSKYPLQLILREILLQNQYDEMMDAGLESVAEQRLLFEGLKYAVIIVASGPVLMLYPFLQRYFVKGVMVGAIKG